MAYIGVFHNDWVLDFHSITYVDVTTSRNLLNLSKKSYSKQHSTATQGPDFDFYMIWLGARRVTTTLSAISLYPFFGSQYEIFWNKNWQPKAPWDVFQMNWVIHTYRHTPAHTLNPCTDRSSSFYLCLTTWRSGSKAVDCLEMQLSI